MAEYQSPYPAAAVYADETYMLGPIPNLPALPAGSGAILRRPTIGSLTDGTKPLEFRPPPGTDFPVRYDTASMRGFQIEVS